MVFYGLIGLAAAVLVSLSLVPDDASARRGGGGHRGGGYYGRGARLANLRGGAVHAVAQALHGAAMAIGLSGVALLQGQQCEGEHIPAHIVVPRTAPQRSAQQRLARPTTTAITTAAIMAPTASGFVRHVNQVCGASIA